MKDQNLMGVQEEAEGCQGLPHGLPCVLAICLAPEHDELAQDDRDISYMTQATIQYCR